MPYPPYVQSRVDHVAQHYPNSPVPTKIFQDLLQDINEHLKSLERKIWSNKNLSKNISKARGITVISYLGKSK
jgi:hypothetical protein